MADEELEEVDASEDRPRDLNVRVRVPLGVLEDVLGLLGSHAEQRREANETREAIRRAMAQAGHPAGADVEEPE